MRRAAAGARGARVAKQPLRPDPTAGRRSGVGAGATGRGGAAASAADQRPLPAQRARGRSPSRSPSHSRSRSRSRSRRLVLDPHAVNVPLDSAPAVFFMRVRLEETGEIFRAPNCRIDMTVRELKEGLELVAGIPFNLQRLQYLDQGVLMDDTTLRFHDVVPGGVISLCIWHYGGWTELVLAAMEGDPSKLSCLGIADNSLQTVNSQQLEGKKQKLWTSPRAFVALFITSHRGLFDAVRYLLENGANCLSRSPLGRTPLHVAAAMGRLDCIGLLLEHGASIHDKDAKGETPIALARRLNRKQSEQRMLLLHWVMKTGATDLSGSALTKAFQRVKSGFASKYRTQTRLPVAALASGR